MNPAAAAPTPRKRGRPRVAEDKRAVQGSLRMTRARWAKLRALGPDWLAQRIDKAKLPLPGDAA